MSNPLISIVVCCHNRRHYLEQTMESILSQRYKPVEIVVLDDGSTDKTDELMTSYGDKVRYYWQEPQGVAAARTAACHLAKGELIAFQDDDDLMSPDRISQLYEALCKYPSAVFATGDYETTDPEGNRTGKRWLPANPDKGNTPVLIEDAYTAVMWPTIPAIPQTTLFRKADGEQISWFDQEFRNGSSDKDFFARLSLLGPVVYVNEIMAYVRRGHESIWSSDYRAVYSAIQLWVKHIGSMDPKRIKLRKRLQHRMLGKLRKIALHNSRGLKANDPRLDAFVERGLSMLGVKERIAYRWYSMVKLPIRNWIQG